MDEGNCATDCSALSSQHGGPKGKFTKRGWYKTCFTRSGELQCVWLKREWKEAIMVTVFFVAVLAILIFLCFTGTDGVSGPKHRH